MLTGHPSYDYSVSPSVKPSLWDIVGTLCCDRRILFNIYLNVYFKIFTAVIVFVFLTSET